VPDVSSLVHASDTEGAWYCDNFVEAHADPPLTQAAPQETRAPVGMWHAPVTSDGGAGGVSCRPRPLSLASGEHCPFAGHLWPTLRPQPMPCALQAQAAPCRQQGLPVLKLADFVDGVQSKSHSCPAPMPWQLPPSVPWVKAAPQTVSLSACLEPPCSSERVKPPQECGHIHIPEWRRRGCGTSSSPLEGMGPCIAYQ
jgi:hypothetical protein